MTNKIDPLLVDLYPFDVNGEPVVNKLVAAGPPWHGVTLKATEGLYYPNPKNPNRAYNGQWFKTYWPIAKSAGGARYGVDWFRNAYHYARIDQDPVKQAAFHLQVVANAGGWGRGDMWSEIDVEQAENPVNPGHKVLEDWIIKYANEVYRQTKRPTLLYGGSYLRDNKVRFEVIGKACPVIIVAFYGATLPPHIYTDIGYSYPNTLFGWQYRSTENQPGIPAGYPNYSPLSSSIPVDITAVTIAGGIDFIRGHMLFPEDPSQSAPPIPA